MIIILFFGALLFVGCNPANQAVSPGNHIVFFGDSITELGDKPGGYVSLIRDSLSRAADAPGVSVIGAGRSGDRVPDLLERLDRDVLNLHPRLVVIYIGINDVWHHTLPFRTGTSKEDYESGLRELIRRVDDTGARVMLCTPSVIGERPDGSNSLDSMLDEYAAISRRVAASVNVPLCDLRRSFIAYLKQNNPQTKEAGILTTDSVHLNDAGNRFVAGELLKALREWKLLDNTQ